MPELTEPNIKVRKILFTVVLTVLGAGLIAVGYWVGLPIGKGVLSISDLMMRSKLSAGLNAFGFAFILVAGVVNVNPESRWYRRLHGRD